MVRLFLFVVSELKSPAKDGDGAAKALGIFVKAFCSAKQFSPEWRSNKVRIFKSFTYRPFTLEGNFAFAAGLQEMLLQSYAGFIEVLPAVPVAWEDVAYDNLRTEGAFLVSVKKAGGHVQEITILSEKGWNHKAETSFLKMDAKTIRECKNDQVAQ